MTFTAVSAGQLGKSSIVNANWRHVGRLNLDLTPMDNSGINLSDGSLDLGSLTYPWGNLFLNTGGKIYIGGVEFKGGSGGGGGILTAELQSHYERMGQLIPLSDQGILNDAYMNRQNVIITPRVSYVSGTTFIADINKTDIDLMNATTGWTAGTNTPTIAQDTTNKIEGTGSVKMTKASLNGSIDMYKTFTAFSLLDKQLSFSFFPDTITSVTRFYVKLESTAGNDKTYYIPVANISATAWNHITINPNLDTADASTGTFIIGGITKIYFGYTTSSSQNVNVSVDFVVTVDDFILVDATKTYKSFIYDATNQELLKINSVAGTGYHQRNTYTITALTNGYAVGAAFASQRNVTIFNGRAIFPAGLSGAVASTVYDISEYWLPRPVANKTLTMSHRWWDEEFKVSAVPGTTSTKLSSVTDKKAYFKTGDIVVLYDKRNSGIRNMSRYNATVTNNYLLVTLTADSTHSSGEITLTHAGESNSGVDTSYWYAVRLSEFIQYLVEDMDDNGDFVDATLDRFMPIFGGQILFSDNFSTTPNDWASLVVRNDNPSGNNVAQIVSSGKIKMHAESTNAPIGSVKAAYCRNLENYIANNLPGEVTIRHSNYSNDFAATEYCAQIVWGSNLAYTNADIRAYYNFITDGISITIIQGMSGNALNIYNANTLVATVPLSLSASTDYFIKGYFDRGKVKVKYWLVSATEPTIWNLEVSSEFSFDGAYLVLACSGFAASPYKAVDSYMDDLVIRPAISSYICRYSVENVSGNRVYIVNKKTRQDTTNQNPETYQKDAYIEGLTE